jgi:hypothetical protein
LIRLLGEDKYPKGRKFFRELLILFDMEKYLNMYIAVYFLFRTRHIMKECMSGKRGFGYHASDIYLPKISRYETKYL